MSPPQRRVTPRGPQGVEDVVGLTAPTEKPTTDPGFLSGFPFGSDVWILGLSRRTRGVSVPTRESLPPTLCLHVDPRVDMGTRKERIGNLQWMKEGHGTRVDAGDHAHVSSTLVPVPRFFSYSEDPPDWINQELKPQRSW